MLVRFPFTDLSHAKNRPAILLTDPLRVQGRDGHFIFAGTRQPWPGEQYVPIFKDSEEARSMGLKATSFVCPRKLATLEVSLVVRRLGQTPPSLMQELDRMIEEILGLPGGR